jgi:hypothetical protein
MAGRSGYPARMTILAPNRYAGHRFPPESISHAVWLYFRFPLSLRMVEEMLAARGIVVSHETVRQWALKFSQGFANEIRRRLPRIGDKWHLDEVVIKIAGTTHWLWRAAPALTQAQPWTAPNSYSCPVNRGQLHEMVTITRSLSTMKNAHLSQKLPCMMS